MIVDILDLFECPKHSAWMDLPHLPLIKDNLPSNLLDNHCLCGNLTPQGWNMINPSNKPLLVLKVVFLKPTLENTFGCLRIEVANGWLGGGPLYSSWTVSNGSLWVRKGSECSRFFCGLLSRNLEGDKDAKVFSFFSIYDQRIYLDVLALFILITVIRTGGTSMHFLFLLHHFTNLPSQVLILMFWVLN